MFQTPLKTRWVGSAILRAAVVAAFLPITFGTAVSGDDTKIHQQSASHMGTQWHIALYSRDSHTANAAFRDAWSVIAEIDADLSNYSTDSELNKLCQNAPHRTPVQVGEHLWTVLFAADTLSRKSEGAFDVTIGPVSKLWRRARRRKRLPTNENLETARSTVGFEYVVLDPKTKTVQLTKPNMQLDLGGIAKGYAVDRALQAMKAHGIQNAIVNGGGDLAVIGSPPNKARWDVTIAGLNPKAASVSMQLTNAAVATSGDAWQFVTIEGVRYSHIIDPKTGIGTTRRKSATVIAKTCMQADSLASALSILPQPKAFELIRSAGAQARIAFAPEDPLEGEASKSNSVLRQAIPKTVSTELFPDLHRTE